MSLRPTSGRYITTALAPVGHLLRATSVGAQHCKNLSLPLCDTSTTP